MKPTRALPFIVVAILAAPAFAQTSATANIGARLVRPITIVKNAGGDLEFGTIIVAETAGVIQAGTVTLAPATNAETTTGGAIATGGAGPLLGAPAAASFSVSGSKTRSYKIYVTAASVVLTNLASADTVTVNNFTAFSGTGTVPANLPTGLPAATNAAFSGTGNGRVTDTVRVGGTLSWTTGLANEGDYTAAQTSAGNGVTVNVAYF